MKAFNLTAPSQKTVENHFDHDSSAILRNMLFYNVEHVQSVPGNENEIEYKARNLFLGQTMSNFVKTNFVTLHRI